ncbi:MAG: biotin/lipoyl-binding protein [Clostridiales bacterium]|nr:biotin/lipoyl-binding protein [Clostridiales bacterium]
MKNYKITVNGNVYNVTVEEGSVNAAPVAIPMPVQQAPQPAPVQQTPAKAAPAPAPAPKPAPAAPVTTGGTPVDAPMPGTVVKYAVNVGDTVSQHQVVAILEAMKMENEIVAPVSGTVKAINIQTGASVNSGDVLMIIG